MRPVYLEFCGINSFSEPAKIDFRDLLEYGIFGVFGDTGSGKSTILDCIGFALYGDVARSRSGRIADIINYRQDSAYVIYEFEIVFEGRRRTFRVEREIKRKNAAQSVRVFERLGQELLTMADGCRSSNALLARIIGLEQRDFEKCIALPQGEFAQFVKAQRAERLKLISRLFDLEAYGELLTKKANRNYQEANAALSSAAVRLEPYEGVSREKNDALGEELARLAAEEKGAREALLAAREEENALRALTEKKREAMETEKKLSALEEKKGEMEELAGELARLERAARVIEAERDGLALRTKRDGAADGLKRAEAQFAEAEKAKEAAAGYDEEAAEKEIERLTEQRSAAAASEEVRSAKTQAENRLKEIVEEVRRRSAAIAGFDYEKEREELLARIASLGADDPITYLRLHGKDALFREEYATFADEVQSLARKYPPIAADASPLIEKYREKAAGGDADWQALRDGFERNRRETEEAHTTLSALERRKGDMTVHYDRLSHLNSEYEKLKGEIAKADARLEGAPDLPAAERALAAAKREKRENSEKKAKAAENFSAASAALAVARERAKGCEEALEEGRKRYADALRAGGFANADEARELLAKYGDPAKAAERAQRYRDEYAAVSARMAELSRLDLSRAGEEAAAEATRLREEREEALSALLQRAALVENELKKGKEMLAAKHILEKEYAACKKKCELCSMLKNMLEGNKFMEFVAEEYLQTVAKNAGSRLLSLTDGRYFLSYEGGFFVGDNFNGGKMRAVYTLSGGETFLVSLSLALALSAEICAKSLRPIEFFFLDEGFGTLDSHLVDTVMDSLEKLRGEHFSIGIISHVEELKHRIDRKLTVRKATERSGSQIIVE